MVDRWIVVADGDVWEGGFLPGGRLHGQRSDGIVEVPREDDAQLPDEQSGAGEHGDQPDDERHPSLGLHHSRDAEHRRRLGE